MHNRAGSNISDVRVATAGEIEEYRRNNGGGGDPGPVSNWLCRQARRVIEAEMTLLETFNRESAANLVQTRPVLEKLRAEFDAVVNHTGMGANIAAVKALLKYGLPKTRPA